MDSINFNKDYFIRRPEGYSDYLQHQQYFSKQYIEFLNKHDLRKANVCELGAGIGQLGKLSGNPNWLCVDSSSWCNENRVWDNFLCRDVFEILRSFPDNHFDYIISFGFLSCLSDSQLRSLIELTNNKSKEQIHGIYETGNEKYYNVKSIEQWKVFFKPSTEVFFIG